jgi:CheY-like chemotaxis protein
MKKQEKKPLVLAVEDEIALLKAIKSKLEKCNYEVITARTVKQAYHMVEDVQNIDAIWLDHYLPGKKNGLDLVIRLKSSEKYKKIPIFVVSNTAGPDKYYSYMKFGITKYYVKADMRLDKIVKDIDGLLK